MKLLEFWLELIICGPCNGIYYLYEHSYNLRALWNPTLDVWTFGNGCWTIKTNIRTSITYMESRWPLEG